MNNLQPKRQHPVMNAVQLSQELPNVVKDFRHFSKLKFDATGETMKCQKEHKVPNCKPCALRKTCGKFTEQQNKYNDYQKVSKDLIELVVTNCDLIVSCLTESRDCRQDRQKEIDKLFNQTTH